MEYRKFRLLNGKGEIYELTEHNFKVFASEPQGLGFSKTMSLLRLGDENVVSYQSVDLETITLELLFYDEKNADKYQKYVEFVNFISFKPLYLLYQRPNSFEWFRRRFENASLTKTEVDLDGILRCSYQVQTLSFWEDNEVNVLEPNIATEVDSKEYPLVYPFIYGGEGTQNIRLYSKGILESPLEITIDGTITDPQYILYDENDVIYGHGKFIGTFDKVYVNSRESEEAIELIRNDVLIDNPLGYQDLTVGNANEIYVTFLKVKTGMSTMRFITSQEFTGTVKIEWRNRYVSV